MPEALSVTRLSKRRSGIKLTAPVFVLCILLFVALLPLLSLGWIAFSSNGRETLDVWSHLLSHVLPRALYDTSALLLMVAAGTTVIGAGTAWLTTVCKFPGRTIFVWALVLPLAVPSYVAAYTMVEFLDYSGPVQSIWRDAGLGGSSIFAWLPNVRSLWGAGLVFTLVLYPYVFLTCRLVFSMQGASALDAARSLGAGPFEIARRIALPMARPALAAGVALALMETLNDIGAVEILGVKTLTYAVFETWLNRNSLSGAVQLALITLVLVMFLIWIERRARMGRSYATATREKPPALMRLSPFKQALCIILCSLPIVAGLGIPVVVLGGYALRRIESWGDPALITAVGNSVLVAGFTALLATGLAYFILQYDRIVRLGWFSLAGRAASLGYAVPGTVLAIGLLVALAGFDNFLDGILRDYLGVSTGLLLSGSIFIIVLACTLRFLAIAYGTLEAGFARLSPHVDMAARALGRTPLQMAWQVHRPILHRAMAAAFLLVFVDTMKELSATLLLRPFDFETLATFIYDRASQAALEDAAFACLLTVAIGLVPMMVLGGFGNSAKKTRAQRPA